LKYRKAQKNVLALVQSVLTAKNHTYTQLNAASNCTNNTNTKLLW